MEECKATYGRSLIVIDPDEDWSEFRFIMGLLNGLGVNYRLYPNGWHQADIRVDCSEEVYYDLTARMHKFFRK